MTTVDRAEGRDPRNRGWWRAARSLTLVRMTTLDASLNGFSGVLLRPGDDDYDQARRVWNGAIDRRPASTLSARTTSTAEGVDMARSLRSTNPCLGRKSKDSTTAIPQDVGEGGFVIYQAGAGAEPERSRTAPRRYAAAVEAWMLWEPRSSPTAPVCQRNADYASSQTSKTPGPGCALCASAGSVFGRSAPALRSTYVARDS